MLAIVYLILMFLAGDAICRRFFSYISIAHRIAVAFLAGLLFSTVFTYLAALVFSGTSEPLIWANVLFGIASTVTIVLLRRGIKGDEPGDKIFAYLRSRFSKKGDEGQAVFRSDADRRPAGDSYWDWIVIAVCLVVAIRLMFATLSFTDGNFEFAIKSWSDFGPHLSLSQSFALGNNFPTEHPFFPGEAIKYHFLFWFQAANLSFLGVNLVWSVNLLSAFTLVALLMLIMTLAELLFSSRLVARISAILFFFASSSLSYIPFLASQPGMGAAFRTITGLKDFIKTGFPYRGDDWGALGVAVFSNQRHLISAIGIMMIVLIYLFDLYRRRGAIPAPHLPDATPDTATERDEKPKAKKKVPPPVTVNTGEMQGELKTFIFCGVLLGGLPYWNGAVFFSAALIVGGLLVFFPFRRQLLYLIATTVVLGLPQVIMLGAGGSGQTGRRSFFTPGYIITEPTVLKIFEYIGWTFGFKLVLIAVALYFLPRVHLKLFLIFSGVLAVAFMFQLSSDPFNNHKLLNIWNIFALMYTAYALWYVARMGIKGKVLATVLGLAMIMGAVIDLFPLRNDGVIKVPFDNDPLSAWLFQNTKPSDIFLSDRLLAHPILFTGRRLYLGDPLFPTSSGYDILKREAAYKQLFQIRDVNQLIASLNDKKIVFVAVDDGLRKSNIIQNFDESIFQQNFERVFDDPENRYRNLDIYKVPLR